MEAGCGDRERDRDSHKHRDREYLVICGDSWEQHHAGPGCLTHMPMCRHASSNRKEANLSALGRDLATGETSVK